MVVFPTDDTPPRADKPHICADARSIIFVSPLGGSRIGFVEEGHAFDVAAGVLDYMKGLT